MELLQKPIKNVFFKYMATAFGSALISSIYVLADTAFIGRYEGPNGVAALAVISPIWNIIFSLGLLTGIGGSVLYSSAKGKRKDDLSYANAFFTVSFILTAIIVAVVWFSVFFFQRELLTFFRAEESLMPLALKYLKGFVPFTAFFIINQFLSAFLRNDNAPGLATAAVVSTGLINIVGDYIFVFVMDMGIYGAGLATGLSALISFIVMMVHFFTKKNTLRLEKPLSVFKKMRRICVTGFPSFLVDIAMGVLTILFNRQVLKYFGTDALAVYGIIVNVGTIVQCCAYSIGQAAQPILSINYGAGRGDRVKETLKYSIFVAIGFAALWTLWAEIWPMSFVNLFMNPTEGVTAIAPSILRRYCLSFLLLPLNIYSTYYFQSLLKPGYAFAVSLSRGVIISGLLIILLPLIFPAEAIWFAMPITELIVSIFVITSIRKLNKKLLKN